MGVQGQAVQYMAALHQAVGTTGEWYTAAPSWGLLYFELQLLGSIKPSDW